MVIDKEVKSPSIIVNVCEANENIIREVLAGIEEESIPYEIRTLKVEEKNSLKKCYTLAQESKLGIGILINKGRIIVQYNKLKESRPILDKELNYYEKEKARIIGSNAARLYKREPLKELDDKAEPDIVEQVKNRVIEILKANLK